MTLDEFQDVQQRAIDHYEHLNDDHRDLIGRLTKAADHLDDLFEAERLIAEENEKPLVAIMRAKSRKHDTEANELAIHRAMLWLQLTSHLNNRDKL